MFSLCVFGWLASLLRTAESGRMRCAMLSTKEQRAGLVFFCLLSDVVCGTRARPEFVCWVDRRV